MKVTMTKQLALKALLLATLTASLSGNALKSIDLASGTTDEVVGGPADPETTDVPLPPLSQSPNSVKVQPTAPPPAAAVVRKQVQPVRIQSAAPRAHELLKGSMPITVCSIALKAAFSEILEGSTYKTMVVVSEKFEVQGATKMPSFAFKTDGTFDDNGLVGTNTSAKNEILAQLKGTAAQKLREVGRCDTEFSAGNEEREPRGEMDAKQKKLLAERIANCQMDARTRRPLPTDDKLRCNIDRLSRLSDIDDDNSSRARTRVEHQLDLIVKNEIANGLRNRLLSKDPAIVADAEQMTDDAIAQIQDLGTSYGIDGRRIEKLVGNLQGLRYGAQTYHAAIDLAEDEKTLKQDIADSKRQYGSIQPYIISEYQDFQNRMNTEVTQGPYAQLLQYRSSMDAREFQTFTQPYDSLRADLQTLANGGNQQVPGQTGQFNPLINRQPVPAFNNGGMPNYNGGATGFNNPGGGVIPTPYSPNRGYNSMTNPNLSAPYMPQNPAVYNSALPTNALFGPNSLQGNGIYNKPMAFSAGVPMAPTGYSVNASNASPVFGKPTPLMVH